MTFVRQELEQDELGLISGFGQKLLVTVLQQPKAIGNPNFGFGSKDNSDDPSKFKVLDPRRCSRMLDPVESTDRS